MPEDFMQIYNTMTVAEQKEIYDFALFLFSKKMASISKSNKKSCFGALKNKIKYIASDFDAPIEDFEDYE